MTREEYAAKIKNNVKFKRKVDWYNLGQRRCHICCKQLVWVYHVSVKNSATLEHLVPSSQGGTISADNILIVCKCCNDERRNMNWIKWVNKKNPPKKEWLIEKYVTAVKNYKTKKVKIDQINFVTTVNIYLGKE
jgi:hypothetical protein